MISFPKLGQFGRLGNQLFQYAFLRTTARRLGVSFQCPKWDGDDIFDLQDAAERVFEPVPMKHFYDPHPQAGYVESARHIVDETEIQGFFQSERFFTDPSAVRSWYRFKDGIRDRVLQKYPTAEWADAVSVSLRLDGDYANTREYFPLYPLSYYEAGLKRAGSTSKVLVFADRPDLARQFLAPLTEKQFRFVDDLNGPEQLFLMTQCCANILTNSTFAWWGGWLNSQPQRQVVAPSAWCRPGVPNAIEGILCEDWIKVSGTLPVLDHFQMWRLRHPVDTLNRLRRRFGA